MVIRAVDCLWVTCGYPVMVFAEFCLRKYSGRVLCHTLSRLQVQQADRLLFVADAAAWIWNRVDGMLERLGMAADRVYQLIDFYHAVEHLGQAAAAVARFSAAERKRWLGKQRKRLWDGKIDQVIEELRTLSRGRPKVRSQLNSFVRHQPRMQYAIVRNAGLPIGSGAVESAVRRVLNLRLKGPSIYWLNENAEAMLMLRSFYKAGRLNLLKNMALSPLSYCDV